MANTWEDVSIGTLYTTAIQYDATATIIDGLLEGIYGLNSVVVEDDTDFTITFSANTGDSDLIADFTSLTGDSSASLTLTQAYVGYPIIGSNSGTKNCDCIITCNMTGNSTGGLKITLVETSEYLDLDRSLSNGDEIIFNSQTRMVTVNSSDARADLDFNSIWFKLPSSTFTVQPDTNDVEIDVVYRSRWI